MTSTLLPDAVFKAYDIRGTVPAQLNTTFAHLLGQALGTEALKNGVESVVVGYDGRHSSPDLAKALHAGINSVGANSIDLGLVPTPVVYYAAHVLKTGTGVAITGSHNPPEYNGFKMMMAGRTLHGDDIQQLKHAMQAGFTAAATLGECTQQSLLDQYIEEIHNSVRLVRPMKVAIDCGNGAAAVLAEALFQSIGCKVDMLYGEVDGDFPNHHPDPADPANLADLIHHVENSDCELGLAFDGDGDRLGVVTKSGEIIWPDRQLVLFARDILQREPGASIIYDVKCSRHVGLEVSKAGGTPLMWQTGHSLIKAKLAETGAPLAGEMSGHIFFKERWYGFDDGLYTGTRLLEILARSHEASETLEALPQDLSTPELKLPMQEGEPHLFVAQLQQSDAFETAQERITIDGIRAEYEDGFGLARASNTTPVVVLRFEAQNEEALVRIQNEFRTAIQRLRPDLALPF
ncbi:phosphomannomutase/phosphoglucomutase [Paenalcaligenes suwonensis]|uniref:phosphomannomutase/phosphoglucomutase n=1 Tax=Paenalcaligenes suwonensis TaxID=1202713 RepID=UPI001408DE70|nr:phosphomannomutase/phosphoglucomutase [Paenalcaligenes suwonensis]NHC60781.1 phosphomannomutase/phosphoglucomutase [Paenalcaligenes suwonensis]